MSRLLGPTRAHGSASLSTNGTLALASPEPPEDGAMMDGADRTVFPDVEVLDGGGLVLKCRIDGKIVHLPPLRMLPGTTIRRTGDRGILVLEHTLAIELGLV